jgi:hypothetical protein
MSPRHTAHPCTPSRRCHPGSATLRSAHVWGERHAASCHVHRSWVPVSTSSDAHAMPSASRPSNAPAAAYPPARGCQKSEPVRAVSPEVVSARHLTPSGCP